jgi:hypothetical protein
MEHFNQLGITFADGFIFEPCGSRVGDSVNLTNMLLRSKQLFRSKSKIVISAKNCDKQDGGAIMRSQSRGKMSGMLLCVLLMHGEIEHHDSNLVPPELCNPNR